MSPIKLAAISLTSTAYKSANLAKAEDMVRQAVDHGAQWVQLPEMLNYHGSYEKVWQMAEADCGPTWQRFADLAKELNIILFAGTLGVRPEQDQTNPLGHKRVANILHVFGRDGTELGRYQKTHLFNLYNEDGSPHYCESDGYISGEQPKVLTIDGLNVGLSICYDLRFPELYCKLAQIKQMDVIVVPSAFTKATGAAHWMLLLKARAVEWQSYVFAANQVGEHAPGKESFGHSTIIDPWGEVLGETSDKPEIAYGELSLAKLASIRHKLPALANRRPALY